MDMQALGLYLRGLREDRKRTQAEAADLINVAPKTVERWEAGKNRPSAPALAAYVQLLGGEAEDLMCRLAGTGAALEDEDLTWFLSLSPEQKRKVRALLDAAEGRLPPRE